jgi:bifunctional non-homologous end joining protein LigD
MFRVAARPRFIEPQLASPVEQPPEGKHWIHEIKHDDYRCQVLVERGKARVFTRNGYDWTDRYPSIVRAAANLRCRSAIIDGEAIVQNGNGASDFEALSSALRRQPHSIILYAFDLLHLDGKDLRQQTLMERRASLKHLLAADDQSRIQLSDEFDGDGHSLLKACAEQELGASSPNMHWHPIGVGEARLGSRPSASNPINLCGGRHGSGPQDRSA